ncbi:MAG: prepilin-type N-terminal cleavage/methylation domain-containing protein [Pyrinomonadaceae bacterium]
MKAAKTNSQAGFSLIELVVGSTIFLIVMAAVFSLLQIGTIARDTVNNSSETTNNARVAVNSVGRDAVNAGLGYSRVGAVVPDDFAHDLLGIPADSDSERDLMTAIISGNEVSTSDLSLPGEKNDTIAFFYRDLDFNSGSSVTIGSAALNGNHVELSMASGSCVSCNTNDLYLIESANGDHALGIVTNILNSGTKFRFAFNDPLDLNRKGNIASSIRSILTPCTVGVVLDCFNYQPQATLKRVFLTAYSVDSSGTLLRKTFGNNTGGGNDEQIREIPIAHGVQRFQVRYLLQNGTFTDDPTSGSANQGNMNEVVQIEVKITIQPDSTSTAVTTSQLINLTSTFSTRNIKYDVE